MDSFVSPASLARLAELVGRTSIEVTARDLNVVDAVSDAFPRGIDVHVTFLPDDDYEAVVTVAARLREAGYNPVPHLTARNFTGTDALNDHLARLADRAGVTRVLAISGDVDRPRGPFAETLQMLQTGLLQRHGITSILVAGHPEGHPAVADDVMSAALKAKFDYARGEGLDVQIVTQFAFEAEPILSWIARMRAAGIDAPVRIGVAGPASTTALIRFATRCGIGNSLRALRKQGARLSKLLTETKPDDLLCDLAAGWDAPGIAPVGGVHLYMFGGIAKTGKWRSNLTEELLAASKRGDAGQEALGAVR